MATIHGDKKAGQYAKRKALSYSIHMIRLCMLAMFLGGTFLGLVLALNLLWKFNWIRVFATQIWYLALAEISTLVAVLWGLHRLDKYFDEAVRERVKYLRGGQCEALVAWYLNELPKTWHVFHNVKFCENCDWDHVLVGPGGLFCISTKSARGHLTADDGKYSLNGKETRHLHEAQNLAMQLKDRLTAKIGAIPWVQAVLLVPFAFVDFPSHQSRAWVLTEHELDDLFENMPTKLNAAEIVQCAEAIDLIAKGAGELV
ncbi:MAG: NERD domain-containing protein [Planctomycetota bacterium]|nr:NERD domain-containing protein [Planctomycetota bacterium]